MSKIYLDHSELKELDKVVADCENTDGNDEPSAGHLQKILHRRGHGRKGAKRKSEHAPTAVLVYPLKLIFRSKYSNIVH